MKDHITPMTGRNSFTPNIKFLWRFFSCQQSKYFSVEASNEQEARSMLPDSPCLFSARIRQPSQNVVGVSA
ncbi:host cell division inhibitor Icd-like protein [Providencia rettgeri]|uniref:host cell division inhibitor Icd-like protein n=1 Tax=Providencia rettgeri TaxID=587 RepID=UPI003015CC55